MGIRRFSARLTIPGILIAAGLACAAPSLENFARESELFGPDFPGEPDPKNIQLDPVYEEQVEVVYWDNEREDALGTVVFMHGVPNNKRTFLYLFRHLEDDWRVIAPDMPGFGFSSKPKLREAFPEEDVYSCNTMAYFFVNFIERLEKQDRERRETARLPANPDMFRNLTVISNSYGCAGVMSALIETPRFSQRVSRIVFISPAVYYQRVLENNRIRRVITRMTFLDPLIRAMHMDDKIAVKSYLRIFHEDFLPNDPTRYRIPREQIEETQKIMDDPGFFYVVRNFAKNLNPWNYERLVSNYHTVEQPTLIIGGGHDQIVPNIFPRRLVNDMPNAELHVFDNCGHQPHLERPDETNLLVENWLRDKIGVSNQLEAVGESSSVEVTEETSNVITPPLPR